MDEFIKLYLVYFEGGLGFGGFEFWSYFVFNCVLDVGYMVFYVDYCGIGMSNFIYIDFVFK